MPSVKSKEESDGKKETFLKTLGAADYAISFYLKLNSAIYLLFLEMQKSPVRASG
jgi:hypothetical protein